MAFEFPAAYRFADSHEYAHLDGELIRVGISAFAVDQLGDIVFVDLPDVGASLDKGTSFGSVESVKAVEDMYAPLQGKWSSAMKRCWRALKNSRTIPMARDGFWWCVQVIRRNSRVCLIQPPIPRR